MGPKALVTTSLVAENHVMNRLALVACSLTVLAGCSFGPPVISAETMSKEAETQLRKQNEQLKPGQMKCPELVGEVGRKIRCVRSAHVGIWDATVKGTVTVTKVEGDQVDFDIAMDDDIASFAADRKTNETILADSLEVDRKQVSCPDPIPAKVGTVGYCVGKDDDGGKHRIKMTVTNADLEAQEINYDYEVVD